MKRQWRGLFVFLLLCLLPAVCASAFEHEHRFEVQTALPPTCTDAGVTVYACVCGESYRETTPASGHAFSMRWTVDREPTCHTEGLQSRHCLNCSATTDQMRIATTQHSFLRTTVPPTCTTPGYTHCVCTVCGDEMNIDTVPATGHTPGAWVVDRAADCETEGLRHLPCTVCGAPMEQRPIAKTGHTYLDRDVAPTCTEQGYTLHTCRVCGAEKKDHIVKATGHTFPETGVTVVSPGCTSTGTSRVFCRVCGTAKDRSIPALGHSYGGWTVDKQPTCTAQGEQSRHCVRCGKRSEVTALPRKDHTLQYDVVTAATCTTPGRSSGAHCAVCGKELEKAGVIPATGHDFAVEQMETEPTCTAEGFAQMRCTLCGLQQSGSVPALGHDYDESWTVDKKATCNAQGEQSRHCSRCGKRKDVTTLARLSHEIVTDKAKKATCTKDGLTEGQHCAKCGKVLVKQETVAAPGHKTKTARTAATFEQNGKIVKTCLRCGKTVSKETIVRVRQAALSKKKFTYDGKVKKPDVTLLDAKGKKLEQGKDYKLSYDKGRKKIGVYCVRVTLKGRYAGVKELRFQITPRKPTALDASQTASRITLSWSKVKGATRYDVYEWFGKERKRLCSTTELYAVLKNRAAGQKATFTVVAVSKTASGTVKSDHSAKKLTATKPAALTLSAQRSGQTAKLQWNNAGNCEYEIYYAPKKNGKFLCIGTTKKTSFTTGVYPRGTRGCFKVKACVKSETATLSSQSSDIRTVWF